MARSKATVMHLGGLYKTACGRPVHGRGTTNVKPHVTCKLCQKARHIFGSTITQEPRTVAAPVPAARITELEKVLREVLGEAGPGAHSMLCAVGKKRGCPGCKAEELVGKGK